MAIIDFRLRPAIGNNWDIWEMPDGSCDLRNRNEEFNFTFNEKILDRDNDKLLEELDAVGITKAVIPGRGFKGAENKEQFDFADKYPDRFIVFPGIDPRQLEEALDVIDKDVIHGAGQGVVIEPGLEEIFQPLRTDSELYDFDDKRADVIYEKLEKEGIPIMITYSYNGLVYHEPYRHLYNVAAKHPDLKIVVAHGGWPWTRENIAIAWRFPNVYLVPDIYGTRGPGARDYIEAAQTILKDKIIFGSSYPITPITEHVQFIRENWGLDSETEEKVFYKNAARVLGIE